MELTRQQRPNRAGPGLDLQRPGAEERQPLRHQLGGRQRRPRRARLEVTRDKRVVYKFDDHALVKSATTVIVLDD
jgi:hypothetical protein